MVKRVKVNGKDKAKPNWAPPGPNPAKGRSIVSNGTALFFDDAGVSLQSQAGRRYRDLVASYEAKVAGKRNRPLSDDARSLARACASLALRCEQLDAALLNGTSGPGGEEAYARTCMSLLRIRKELGLSSDKAKPAAPPLRKPRPGGEAYAAYESFKREKEAELLLEDDEI
jgi:hypothetical protein